MKIIGATTKRSRSKKENTADFPRTETQEEAADFSVSEHRAKKKPKCEIKTEYCSGSLMAKFKGTKKGDPEFWCCGACMAMLKRQGMKSSSLKRIG